VVLVCPGFEVHTPWVYKNLNLGLTNCDKNFKIGGFGQDLSRVRRFLLNDLEQVTIGKFPQIETIKKALLDLGAEAALMSGSGPSVFGLFTDAEQATKAIQGIIRLRRRERWKTFLVELLLP
jgi:4-diphosphocytidyl-2-C-methyl-D-erythritol kinase